MEQKKALTHPLHRRCLPNREGSRSRPFPPPFSGSWAGLPRRRVISCVGVLDIEPKTTAVSHQMPRHLQPRAELSHPPPLPTHTRTAADTHRGKTAHGAGHSPMASSTLAPPCGLSCHRRNAGVYQHPGAHTDNSPPCGPGTVLGPSYILLRFLFRPRPSYRWGN